MSLDSQKHQQITLGSLPELDSRGNVRSSPGSKNVFSFKEYYSWGPLTVSVPGHMSQSGSSPRAEWMVSWPPAQTVLPQPRASHSLWAPVSHRRKPVPSLLVEPVTLGGRRGSVSLPVCTSACPRHTCSTCVPVSSGWTVTYTGIQVLD